MGLSQILTRQVVLHTTRMTKKILLGFLCVGLTMSQDGDKSLDVNVGDILGEEEISSNLLEVIEAKSNPDVIPMNPIKEQQPEFNRNPYLNTFQRTHKPLGSRPAYSHNGLDIIGYGGQSQAIQNQRPTIDSLNSYAASQGQTVTTPEELLDMWGTLFLWRVFHRLASHMALARQGEQGDQVLVVREREQDRHIERRSGPVIGNSAQTGVYAIVKV